MDRGAWWVTVHGVAKSQTQLKQLSMHTQCETGILKSSKDHTGKVDGGLSEPPGLAIRTPLWLPRASGEPPASVSIGPPSPYLAPSSQSSPSQDSDPGGLDRDKRHMSCPWAGLHPPPDADPPPGGPDADPPPGGPDADPHNVATSPAPQSAPRCAVTSGHGDSAGSKTRTVPDGWGSRSRGRRKIKTKQTGKGSRQQKLEGMRART